MKDFKKKDPSQLFEMANNFMEHGNPEKAVELFEEASELGHLYATTNLGICYFYGDGVEKNMSKAKNLFQKAEKGQDSSAIYYLSLILHSEKEYLESFRYLKKASELGNQYAQHDLGELYITGSSNVVKQDIRQAIHWFAYAAQQGHPEAGKKFEMLYYGGYETKKAPTGFWFEREQLEQRSIPCCEPFKVLISDSEYVVPGLQIE